MSIFVNLKDLFNIIDKININSAKIPHHVALTMQGTIEYAQKNELDIKEVLEKRFSNIKEIIRSAVKLNIPIITFYTLSNKTQYQEYYSDIIDSISSFFDELSKWEFLDVNKIKVSVLGKWYDLPNKAVDSIKSCLDSTKDYDNFFLNFCINYDGQEEIVDAIKLITRQINVDKIDPEKINKDLIKENLYSSYFLPPNVLIKTGFKRTTDGFLLWDSSNTFIHFADKSWSVFTKVDFLKAIEDYQKHN